MLFACLEDPYRSNEPAVLGPLATCPPAISLGSYGCASLQINWMKSVEQMTMARLTGAIDAKSVTVSTRIGVLASSGTSKSVFNGFDLPIKEGGSIPFHPVNQPPLG